MAVIKQEVTVFICERCGHRWTKRKERQPRICPNCKSVNWDIPKKKPSSNTSRKEK